MRNRAKLIAAVAILGILVLVLATLGIAPCFGFLVALVVPVICIWFPEAAGYLVTRRSMTEPAPDRFILILGWIGLFAWAIYAIARVLDA